MSVDESSQREDLASRFLRHLTGKADESERRELERAVLEDDELFEQISELESELIDAYVEGELDEETTHGLASLVATSPRLQAKAETTLALSTRRSRAHSRGPLLDLLRQSERHFEHPQVTRIGAQSRSFILYGGLFLAIMLIGLLIQVMTLRTELIELRAENLEARANAEAFEAKVSELEASNRILTRSLARLEAERTR